jgi:phosphate transport system permease protein
MTMTAPAPAPPAPGQAMLSRGLLPRWFLAAAAGAAAAVVLVVFLVMSWRSYAGYVALSVLVFQVLVTAASIRVEGRRRALDRAVTTGVTGAFLVALAPLVSVLAYTVKEGRHRFDYEFFSHSLRGIGARDAGGGAYHALIGTLEQVLIATVICVPFGLLVAIYIVEYGRGRLAALIRFFVDVMTGIPSIVAGLFVLSFWILGLHQGFSGFAAALALSVLMLPIIVRSSEEMLKLVPDSLREASLALGVPRWKTILRIVLPTALPGIVTGIMLAVARVAGETAPVLLTAFGLASINNNPFTGPQSSLPLFVFQQAGDAQTTAINRAWTAALTVILVVMVLNLLARLLTRRNRLQR